MATAQETLQRVWSDPKFKDKLLSDPKPVLAELGIQIDPKVQVTVHENTPKVANFVFPRQSDIPPGTDIEKLDPVIGKIIKKAWAEPAFKSKLMSNPKVAVAEATGIKLPDTLSVNLFEDSESVRHLVLPINPATGELSDLELEGVAGGASKGAVSGAVVGGACGVASAAEGTVAAAMTIFSPTAATAVIAGVWGIGAGASAAVSAIGGAIIGVM